MPEYLLNLLLFDHEINICSHFFFQVFINLVGFVLKCFFTNPENKNYQKYNKSEGCILDATLFRGFFQPAMKSV